jgi:hypothetical protein
MSAHGSRQASRERAVARMKSNGWLCVTRRASHCWWAACLVPDAARETARSRGHRGGDPLCAEPLVRAGALRRRWTYRTRLEQYRTRNASCGTFSKEFAICRQRRGRRKSGVHGFADRDLQAQRRQSADLDDGFADASRQWLAAGSDRQTHAVVLEARTRDMTAIGPQLAAAHAPPSSRVRFLDRCLEP